jgi:hypothetical protein
MQPNLPTSDAPQEWDRAVASMKVSELRRLLCEELEAALRNIVAGIPPTPRCLAREPSTMSSSSHNKIGKHRLGDRFASFDHSASPRRNPSPAGSEKSDAKRERFKVQKKGFKQASAYDLSPANAEPEAQEKKKAIAQSLERSRLEMKQHREQERHKLKEKKGAASLAAERFEEKCIDKFHKIIPGGHDEAFASQSGSFVRTYIRPVIESMAFRSVVTSVIVANSIFIYFFTDELIRYESGQVNDWWLGYQLFEDFFLVFYCWELVLRVWVYRSYFFCGDQKDWNLFDLGLVVSGVVTRIFEAASADPAFLRVIRLLKIVKIFRSFRLLRQLDALRILLNCLLGTFWELIWSMIMMMVVFFMFSTVLVQLVSRQLHLADDEGFRRILDSFGSEAKAIMSLYKATTGGDDWSQYYDLLASVSNACGVVFLCLICFTQVALLNIVTGLFIDKAMDHAKPDVKGRALIRAKDNLELLDALETLAERINSDYGFDGDNRDSITVHKFCKSVNEEMELRNMLQVLGLDLSDTEAFFELLLETQGYPRGQSISVDDFVSGCLTLKGEASARSIIALTGRVKLIVSQQERCMDLLSKLMGENKDTGDWNI